MLNRACAVSLIAVASLVAGAGAATTATSPQGLTSTVSSAAAKGQWDLFLECFTPSARKSLMVSLAKPIFSAASANDNLEGELARRLDSLGVSKSAILSGKDLSRQARFVELLFEFSRQNNIAVPTIFTNANALKLSGDGATASIGTTQQNGVPTSFVLVSQSGGYLFDLPSSPNTTAGAFSKPSSPAQNTHSAQVSSGSWIKPGLFPEFRDALKSMRNAPSETPAADWFTQAPSRELDANPGQIVYAYFPGDDGNNLHVCMLMGLSRGTAKLLTQDGTIVSSVPASLVTPASMIEQQVGRAPMTGDSVLAIRHDGGAFYGQITGFENNAPIVSYFDRSRGQMVRGAMDAAIPLSNTQSPVFQMLAFSCDGEVESGLCVASYDGGVWMVTPEGLESRSGDQVQLLTWVGTDTREGVELFQPSTQNAMAFSGNLLPTGTNFEIELTPALYPTPTYTLGGVDTDNDN